MIVRPRTSTTRVFEFARRRTSSLDPTARILSCAIATASAVGRLGSPRHDGTRRWEGDSDYRRCRRSPQLRRLPWQPIDCVSGVLLRWPAERTHAGDLRVSNLHDPPPPARRELPPRAVDAAAR